MENLIHYVLFPLTFTAILNGFLISLLVVIPMSILSCFIILKNQSFVGEAIAHSVLPGIVLAHIAGISLGIGAFIAAIVCTLCSGYLKEKIDFKEDILLSIVFSSMFAIGIILMLKVQSAVHFNHILLGDMLGISRLDIIETAFFSFLSLSFLILKKNDLLVIIFDPMHARSVQIPIKLLHYMFLIVLSLVIVISLKSIGLILPPAVLVLPGATAFLLSKHHTTMILIAIMISIVSTILGIYLSFFINSAAAPTIVMLMAIFFAISFLYSVINKRKKTFLLPSQE
ncbi:metal ABC transporter permease [Candidatus Liberibacter solanacearum]|uniref:Metal ABC transporter permease n=1 Tax=Candidatus Liberibacter solanacearum TaxID=556287 RepID=A0A424FKZ0_9HYPH|nr:metal ABC transporter permease [Candidatus Liberibacter solanacearum]RPD36792.1 metal ABC transporter permease [Candidatus Liberibacter solanacearum]